MFLAPVAVAFYLYYSGWQAEGDVSHGNLITPARPLPAVPLSGPDGDRLLLENVLTDRRASALADALNAQVGTPGV